MSFKRDARSKPIPRATLGTETQSIVFGIFDDDSKLSVNDAYHLVVKKQISEGETPFTEQTVRRAINALTKKGFLVAIDRQSNATLYSKQSTARVANQGIIPLGGEPVSVETFLRLFAEHERPLKLKASVLNDKIHLGLRRSLLFTVISAGNVGSNAQLRETAENLQKILDELEYASKVIKNIINSPIWYDQYRDRIAYEVREVQKKDPELVQLAIALVKGG